MVDLEFKPKSVSNQYFCTPVFANLKEKGGLIKLEIGKKNLYWETKKGKSWQKETFYQE